MSSKEFNKTHRLNTDDLSLVRWRLNYDFVGDSVVLADMGRHQVKSFNTTTRVTSSISGIPHVRGFRDGPASVALFSRPSSVSWLRRREGFSYAKTALLFRNAECLAAYDAGGNTTANCLDNSSPFADFALVRLQRLFNSTEPQAPRLLVVSDTDNHCVRVVDVLARQTRTLAGKCGEAGFADGFLRNGRLNAPDWLGTDESNRLYVHDGGNACVRVIELPSSFTDVESFALGARLLTLVDGACVDLPVAYLDEGARPNREDFRFSFCYRAWLTGPDSPSYFDFAHIDSYCVGRSWECGG